MMDDVPTSDLLEVPLELLRSALRLSEPPPTSPPPPMGDKIYVATKTRMFGPFEHPITTERVRAEYEAEGCLDVLAELVGVARTRPELVSGIGPRNFAAGHARRETRRQSGQQQPTVGAVIVGTRLGVAPHGDENGKVFESELDDPDLAAINAVAVGDEPWED
ncbi:hypothetical protein DL765_001152 [Monosporascus sp. GIB2]|nr:hypothetical protein DL765_001152 [Monosporascus sp. GIB2]